MARSRNIKPGFFVNDELGEQPPEIRLLAIGLPCIADREGRLEDRPRKIKVQLLPYDNTDVDAALNALQAIGFIQRYVANECHYIQIVNFSKHQNPHKNEAPSSIPAPEQHHTSTVQVPELHSSNRADSFNPITDSLNPSKDWGLPAWIDAELWQEFEQHRKEIRAKLTPTATARLIANLDKHRALGADPNEALRQSIENQWRGVFPERLLEKANAQQPGRKTATRENNDERRAREADEHRRRILAN